MKITVIPTGNAPMFYSFNGEVVTAHYSGLSEGFDFSALTENDQFIGVETDSLDLPGAQIIRNAERINGELYVTLCQKVGPGHWICGHEIDSSDYDPAKINVTLDDTRPYSGKAYAVTAEGKQWVQ